MRIRARASDWHSGNPNVRPAMWFGMVICALVVCGGLAALAGSILNGAGMPNLS